MARRTIHESIEIDAPPERVWQVFSDLAAYPEWNPFILELRGQPVKNAKLIMTVQPPGGKRVRLRPRVLVAEPNRELRWLGRALVPGLFDGEHAFLLEPLDGDRTRFTQHEELKGLLIGPMSKTLDRTEVGFRRMNEALKQRVEQP
jgi:hypothetical protein